jgi:hypothetical protein
MRPTVFISCGQVTPAEISIGKKLCELVVREGRYEPYFAENQSTLEGVTNNILDRLIYTEAFVGILHPRGEVHISAVSGALPAITRASVWVEQEIAILAAASHAQRRQVQVQLYVKRGVVREGLRLFVMANPYEFDDEVEIEKHFENVLRGWNVTLGPRAISAAGERLLSLCADVGEISIERDARKGSYVRIPGGHFNDPADRAVAAKYVAAVDLLLQHGLARQIDENRYELSATGFARARALPRDRSGLLVRPVVQIHNMLSCREPMKLRLFLKNVGPLIPTSVQLRVSCPSKYIDSVEARLNVNRRMIETIHLNRMQLSELRPDAFHSRAFNHPPLLEIPLYGDLHRRDDMKDPVDVEILLDGDVHCTARFAPEQLWDHDVGAYCALAACEGDELSVVYGCA